MWEILPALTDIIQAGLILYLLIRVWGLEE